MRSPAVARLGCLILAGAVYCYAQHGHGGGGHMGGPPSWSNGGHSGMGHSGTTTSSHSTQSGSQTQTQGTFPKQLQDPNSKLSTHLQKLLPTGTTPQQACTGFKNLGQCVAAIHVSHNLGISFSDLKTKMTGSNSESLGKAIQDLKPTADSSTEKKKAEKEAKDDMNGSGS